MRNFRPSIRAFLGLLALVLAFHSPHALAQQQSGGIVFEVTDPDDKPLPGVSITLSGAKLAGSQFHDTDERGRATFALLPPGTYLAEITATGYLSFRREIQVGLGTATIERIKLTKGELSETVKVTAAQPIDPTEVGSKTSYDAETLQKIQLGSGNRSYQSAVQQAAGVGGGSNPSVRGSTLGENTYLIDGVNTTDPVTGTFGLNTIFDAIDTVEVGTGGFEAEYGQITGGLINQLTKSGTNDFAGSFDFRYNDQNFDLGNTQYDNDADRTFRDGQLVMGGPIVKDKLFWLVGYQNILSEDRPGGSLFNYSFEGENLLAKLTWKVTPDHTIDLQTQQADEVITGANAGAGVSVESSSTQNQPSGFTRLTYFGRLTDRWTLTGQMGFYESSVDTAPTVDSGVPATVDLFTGDLYDNYNDAQYSNRYNNQYAFSAQYFTPTKRLHQIKFGVDWQDRSFSFRREQPGGAVNYVIFLPGGGEYLARRDTLNSVGELEDTGTVIGLYVQDKWQITKKVSMSYGLRRDQAAYDRDDGEEVLDVALLQPRIGMAYDFKADGKDVFTWHYGRQMHPGILTVASAVNSRADSTLIELDEAAYGIDCTGDGDVDDGLQPCFLSGGAGGSKVADDLDPTKMDEFQVGYSHAFKPNLVFNSTMVWRYTSDIIEDTDADDDGVYSIENIDELYRRYWGLELGAKWNTKRWHLMGNWTISKSKGNIEYTQNLGVDWDYVPQHSINRDGYLSYDREHRFKVQGWVDLPRKWTISWDGSWLSGAPYNRVVPTAPYGTEYVEARGSRRLPSLTTFDAEIRKSWSIKEKVDVSLIGTITNFFNFNSVTGVYTSDQGDVPIDDDGDGTPDRTVTDEPGDEIDLDGDWGEPNGWQQPRHYEVGFRIEW